MNKIAYSLFVLLLICLPGCTQEESLNGENLTEKEYVTLSFIATIPEFKTVGTRASGGVNSMYLLVFDENGNFIVRKEATLSAQTETGGAFTAELPASTKKRTIHFISNYDQADFTDIPGTNEVGVITPIKSSDPSNPVFWSRVVLDSGISATGFANQSVELLRNQAKISVSSIAPGFTYSGFTIHKAPSAGTVAPYSISSSFLAGVITEPADLILHNANVNDINNTEKYLFERKNASASEITTVIIKGNYVGHDYYYKIDLIDANKNRYNIERNYHYAVKIQTVNRAGYASFEDALNGASLNNSALDPIIEKYPIISDGIGKLEVEKTIVVLTQPNQAMSVWYKFFPSIGSPTVDNTAVSVVLQPGGNALTPSLNISSGTIAANAVNVLPAVPQQSTLVVSKGELARTIRVFLREPFRFIPVSINNQSPAQIAEGQGKDAILRFNIPADFPEDLLPLPVKIFTQGLYAATTGMEAQVAAGEIHYIYRAVSKGQQTIHFKTNKSGNSETITLQADYFTDGQVAYHSNASITISGTIQYNRRNNNNNQWTNVPSNANVIISGINNATIQVSSNGNYVFTMPSTQSNPNITFTYQTDGRTYRQTISLNDLTATRNLRLNQVNN